MAYARTALMRGGIIWRLAREWMGIEVEVDEILEGPSNKVFTFGEEAILEDSAIWDDNITKEEMDIICGTYNVYTSKYLF